VSAAATGAIDVGGGLTLANPVVLASGPFGYGGRYVDLFDVARLGAVVLKGAAPEPWPGNPPPRVAAVDGGLLNAIGLENPGVDAVLSGPACELAARGARVVVNVIGHDLRDFVEVARRASESADIAALELNVSCPNVPDGLRYGTDPRLVAELVAAVRRVTRLPVWVKLPPCPPDRAALARACAEAGADALSLVNTLPALALDRGGRARLGVGGGGLSGPALRPVALLAVAECRAAVRLPIVGMGGIETAEHARAFLAAGATAVAVGTALFRNPLAAIEIVQALEEAVPVPVPAPSGR
jgi:dihydroorotate dehydrogenase (NAD+) catalytic subunit